MYELALGEKWPSAWPNHQIRGNSRTIANPDTKYSWLHFPSSHRDRRHSRPVFATSHHSSPTLWSQLPRHKDVHFNPFPARCRVDQILQRGPLPSSTNHYFIKKLRPNCSKYHLTHPRRLKSCILSSR